MTDVSPCPLCTGDAQLYRAGTGDYPVSDRRYQAVGISKGAGPLRGQLLAIYRDIESGQLYHREIDDFRNNMEPVHPPAKEASHGA